MYKRSLLAIAIGVLLAQTAGVNAEIIHFVNPAPGQPGHYAWEFDAWGATSWLDITLSPEAQTNTPSQNSVAQLAGTFGNLHGEDVGAPGQRALVLAHTGSIPFTAALSYGDAVLEGGSLEFMGATAHISGIEESHFMEDASAYIGVLTIAGNYGWIEVIREGMTLYAIAWAYQTEPGVAIYAGQIPAPGAVALLCGLLCSTRRRRA